MTNALTVGSLFAGIGGFDLGLTRAGFEIAWQVEIDPYCQRVLAKHWPHVKRYGDIRTIDWGTVEPVDLLCGGFPCQDISLAGKGAGLAGERSGLWFEYAKAIEVLKPRYVLIENVSALRSRGLDQVLGALAALGYDAEWHCIPASAVGAPHRRDRVWIVAHANGSSLQAGCQRQWGICAQEAGCGTANQYRFGRKALADTKSKQGTSSNYGSEQACTGDSEQGEPGGSNCRGMWSSHWALEPAVGRVAHGIPRRVDRLRGLGNAIVPQIAEWIGRQIMKVETNGSTQHH